MLRVTEFLMPGAEELASLIPSWLVRRIVQAAERRGKLGSIWWSKPPGLTAPSGPRSCNAPASAKALAPPIGAANFEALMEQVVRPAIAARRSEAARLAALRALTLSGLEGSTMMDALHDPAAAAAGVGRT